MASLGLVGGCTADPPEPVDPSVTVPEVTATPSPTPTTPPEAVKPVEPEAMGLPGTEGAAAAAEYFISLYPYVYATGDLAPWKAMSHPECIFCASVVGNVEAQVAAGEHTTGGLLTFHGVEAVEVSPRMQTVRLRITEATEIVVDRDGAEVRRVEERDHFLTVIVEPGSPWTIREVQVDELPAS